MKTALAMFCIYLCLGSAFAADMERHGFWGAVAVGFGNLALQPEVASSSSGTKFYLGLEGGYTVHPQWQLGVEASGWNIEAGDLWDHEKGEGLMQLFAIARYRPPTAPRVFIKAGAGSVTHWINAPATSKGSGTGYCLGLGYEVARFGSAESHWFITYSSGAVSGFTPQDGVRQDEDYTALSTGLVLGF